MIKKHSLISSLAVNNQNSIINKNLIPHPKKISPKKNPYDLYKKGRNNDIRNNKQNFNNTYENEKSNNLIDFDISSNEIIQKDNYYHNRNRIISNLKENIDNEDDNINKNEENDKQKEFRIETSMIEEKLNSNKNEMENVKNNIERLNKKMIDMKNTLDKLKFLKSEKKKEIQNLLSNKETLEEMYNMEILFMKNGNFPSVNDIEINKCNINISIEDIKQININKFKIQIIELINILFNYENNNIKINNNSFNDYLINKISEAYNIFNQKIKNNPKYKNDIIFEFLDSISKNIVQLNKNIYSTSLINSLLHYLVKINCINEKIEDSNNFIKKYYKLKKQEINQELIEITFSLIFLENQKRKIIDLTSKLKEKLQKLNNNKNIIDDNDFKNENKIEDKKKKNINKKSFSNNIIENDNIIEFRKKDNKNKKRFSTHIIQNDNIKQNKKKENINKKSFSIHIINNDNIINYKQYENKKSFSNNIENNNNEECKKNEYKNKNKNKKSFTNIKIDKNIILSNKNNNLSKKI